MAAYSGPSIPLEDFLIKPEHSLVNQSWRPREMREATLNADGFGIAWFADDGKAASYRRPKPIWSDPNLPALARSLVRNRWLATVRSATLVSDLNYANTQPFLTDDLVFMHNGYLADFADQWRGPLRQQLRPEFENRIHGTTDSEYLFALFCQQLEHYPHLADALSAMIDQLADIGHDSGALLNFIISSNRELVAVRQAIGKPSPTLYYRVNSTVEGDALTIASEALNGNNDWISVAEGEMIIASPDRNPENSREQKITTRVP